MAHCFEFRARSHSDSMTLMPKDKTDGGNGGAKLPRFVSLFRCKSEEAVRNKNKNSPAVSPATNSPGAPRRRRLMRVVRDNDKPGEEFENPYLIRHYSRGYWEKQMEEARQLQHSTSLPYTVNTDHTILKRQQCGSDSSSTTTTTTTAPEPEGSPTALKHASFMEEVEVMEFVTSDKISKPKAIHRERLLDSSEEEGGSPTPPRNFEDIKRRDSQNEFLVAKQASIEEETSSDESIDQLEQKETRTKKKSLKGKVQSFFKHRLSSEHDGSLSGSLEQMQLTDNKENLPSTVMPVV